MNASVYLSIYQRGRALHIVKQSPSKNEPVKQQIPGGYCVIIDEIIQNEYGTWGVINDMTISSAELPEPINLDEVII